MKKICVITGSRADYGLLRWVIDGIHNSEVLELQLLVTGTHFSGEFGLTHHEIKKDGYNIDYKVEMLLSSDTTVGVTKSVGLGIIGFADAFDILSPDIVLLLGDRFEILAAASAAMMARVPIAHIHGGEITEGAIDDSIRHAITKMAHLHFTATESYRNRVIQLGEQPHRVFSVGGLGIDNIKKLKLLDRNKIENLLNFKLGKKNFLITYHPVTLEPGLAEEQIDELLSALEALKDVHLIFTLSNADIESRILATKIRSFVATRKNAVVFPSLGQMLYLSLMAQVDVVIGNSSSGLIEAPALSKWTINIGDRQAGRLKANSVIDVSPSKEDIQSAISQVFSGIASGLMSNFINPYGEGGASDKIVKILEKESMDSILKKRFFDLG